MTPTQALNKCNTDYHANVEGRNCHGLAQERHSDSERSRVLVTGRHNFGE